MHVCLHFHVLQRFFIDFIYYLWFYYFQSLRLCNLICFWFISLFCVRIPFIFGRLRMYRWSFVMVVRDRSFTPVNLMMVCHIIISHQLIYSLNVFETCVFV